TSSFHFKGRNEDLREIGRQLGVAHVLEGSVRRSGEKLRVTVQLVSTADGFHLWSRTYDRELTDVFAIQDDIASQVAGALKLTLLPPATDRPHRETNTQPTFLIATALLRERTSRSLTEARALFEDMLAASPDHPEALAGYAEATILLATAYLTIEFEPAAAAAVDAVERAVALDPDSVAANLAAGVVYESLAFRTDERHYLVLAERMLARAMDLAPNDPDVLRTYGQLLMQLERWEEALAVTRQAVAGDPLNRPARFQLVQSLRGVGKLGEARAELEGMLVDDPDYLGGRLDLGELLVETGAFEAALPHLQRAHAARAAPRASFALAHLYLNVGDMEAVQRTLNELDYAPYTRPLVEMVQHVLHGDDAVTLKYAKAELARSGDRLWRPLVVLFALMTGDLATAREQLRAHEPAVLAPQPDVSRIAPESVLLAANLLMKEGRTAQAKALLERLLARLAPREQSYDPVTTKLLRVHALAQLGRADEVLAELEAARVQGYRTIYDFDQFMRLDRYPTFVALRGDRRLTEFLDAIEQDNRRLAPRLAAAHAP
ncbi:MAG TPA: tetratricopeptide repeat protein, partial [Pseudomonadales bacterium]